MRAAATRNRTLWLFSLAVSCAVLSAKESSKLELALIILWLRTYLCAEGVALVCI